MSIAEVIESIERDAFANCMNPPQDDGLKEYRCQCGRLLGRFNGQAEIKCPKCRKINVIKFTPAKNDNMESCWRAQYQQEPIPLSRKVK